MHYGGKYFHPQKVIQGLLTTANRGIEALGYIYYSLKKLNVGQHLSTTGTVEPTYIPSYYQCGLPFVKKKKLNSTLRLRRTLKVDVNLI